MRIPGEGTDQLINRQEEAQVYQIIRDKKLCDDIEYINPENGYKLTRFLDNARVCDPNDPDDIAKCMKKLRQFHEMKLKVQPYGNAPVLTIPAGSNVSLERFSIRIQRL